MRCRHRDQSRLAHGRPVVVRDRHGEVRIDEPLDRLAQIEAAVHVPNRVHAVVYGPEVFRSCRQHVRAAWPDGRGMSPETSQEMDGAGPVHCLGAGRPAIAG